MKKIMYSFAFAPLLSACAGGSSEEVSLLDKAAFDTVINGEPV